MNNFNGKKMLNFRNQKISKCAYYIWCKRMNEILPSFYTVRVFYKNIYKNEN